MTQLNAQALEFIGGLLIPILVALLAKEKASPAVKAIFAAILAAAASGVLAAQQHNGSVNLSQWAVDMGRVLVTTVATYLGLWKPIGVTTAVAASTSQFGVGATPEEEPPVLP